MAMAEKINAGQKLILAGIYFFHKILFNILWFFNFGFK